MSNGSIYVVGGTVQASNGLYVSRKADDELLDLCRSGAFAYVLTARQMGKSSLMVRTADHLAEEGIVSAKIDLSKIGVNVIQENWYLGLLTETVDQLALDFDLVGWWKENAHLGPTQRMSQFFEKKLLAEVAGRIVIFVDEIDTTLGLDFADDFYAAIRSMYNARAGNRELARLSFVLLGVATPSDLMRDVYRTPFNIGRQVDLSDFNLTEIMPLAGGLGLPRHEAKQTLQWVMKWTNGHPYLTQRLCQAIADRQQNGWSEEKVDRLVEEIFLGPASEKDDNLLFVRDMLTKRAPSPVDVLAAYREIRLGHHVPDEKQSVVKSHLKLSGVVRRLEATLSVRNLLYETVFDLQWIESQLFESPATPAAHKEAVEASVFISSTALDLPEHCQEIMDACLRQGMRPRLTDPLPDDAADQIRASTDLIDQADIYIGVFAYRYGSVLDGHRISLAEIEYDHAVERNIPRLIYVMHEAHMIPFNQIERGEGASKLEAFKDRLRAENEVSFFKSPNELRVHVITRLSEFSRNSYELIKHLRKVRSFRIQSLLARDEP